MSSSQETLFMPKIKKPDNFEASEIVCCQMMRPGVEIVCVFDTNTENPWENTRIPYLHMKNGMAEELVELAVDMQKADYIQIIDTQRY